MVQSYSPGGANVLSRVGTLAPPGKYNWSCAFFGPPESTIQTTNRSVQPILHSSRQKVPIPTISSSFPQIAFDGVIWTPSNIWFPAPTQVINPNGISIGSTVFAYSTAECPYSLECDAAAPSKLLLPMGDLDPNRVFPVVAAKAWNSLLDHVRDATSLLAFCRQLKTVLFRQSYSD